MTLPSETYDVYWIWATRKVGSYPIHTLKGGKWLLFVPIDQIDQVWDIVKNATIDGRLGGISKVSTTKPNPNSRDPNTKVICVYTYDSNDMEDKNRILQSLRNLGFDGNIPYKTDQATREGKYKH